MTQAGAREEGELLWEPSPELLEGCNMTAFMRTVERERGSSFKDYAELWHWSITELGPFWETVIRHFDVRFQKQPDAVLTGEMPDAHWFPGAELNYAEHALRRRDEHPALVFRDESGRRVELSYAELAERVARARCGLRRLGVAKGDRVAALLPNCPEAVIAFLATASLGAIWSSCSPEFGVGSVLDRFRQIEPKVLVAVSGYRYGGKSFDRSADLSAIISGLPSLACAVTLADDGAEPSRGLSFEGLLAEAEPLAFEPVPFEHPLWVLYSSGTTGLPKPIVQGHGGILLEHVKALGLHCDIKPDDRFFWFSTTGWMMWNFLVGGLLLGATIVLYDGSPAYPDLNALWKMAAEERVSYFGCSAPYLLACKKAGISPKSSFDLAGVRAVGTTGAPLPADGFGWVYDQVGENLLLGSVSGGTDVCTAFVLSCPLLPVYAGELQCRGLGAKVESFDEAGEPRIDHVGELVLTKPLPSMPVFFWNDDGGVRLRESYYAVYPGVWRHGDWIKITERGSAVIYGRSDSTLNRGGVRMGTSEFYRVVEAAPEVADSLVVDTGSLDDATGKLLLFLVLRPGVELTAELKKELKTRIRTELSPRHVPDEIRAIAEVPRTLNGKKLEVPVKRILLGTPPEQAASRDTLANPAALEPFIALARERGV